MDPKTILVVDDDPVILKLLEVNFEMEGFQVMTALDGIEGVAAAIEHEPHIVVTDIMMPRKSGIELVHDLRANDKTASIPIILLSAKAQNADIQSGLDAGADDYVTKPFEPLDLVDRVNKLIGDRRPR